MRDNNTVVARAMPPKDMEVESSASAEHGFSAPTTVSAGDTVRSILFDFGFSAHGAAFNDGALNLDLSGVEAAVFSHGHLDHVGGMAELSVLIVTHCTGRYAVGVIEKDMPDSFILNMSGTKVTFS